jgi:hypothetical protein
MKLVYVLVALSLLPSIASAFPVGRYRCTSGDVVNSFEIRSTDFGGVEIPLIQASVKSGQLETALKGLGVIIEISGDLADSETDRRIKLPGTNFEILFDKNDVVRTPMRRGKCEKI